MDGAEQTALDTWKADRISACIDRYAAHIQHFLRMRQARREACPEKWEQGHQTQVCRLTNAPIELLG